MERSKDRISDVGVAVGNRDRLDALAAAAILDTLPEESFDRLTRLASELLQAPVSLVSLVDEDRQFFKSCFGLPEPYASARETPLSHSFCKHVVSDDQPLVVGDARSDPRLENNLAIRDLGVVAYLGIPIRTPKGDVLGSFCAIDSVPRQWDPHQLALMQDLCGAVQSEVELRMLARQLQESHLRLREENLRREEFVQFVTHDLRNPLTSILGCLDLAQHGLASGRQPDEELVNAKVSASYLLDLVNSLVDLSKAESGNLGLERDWISPATLVDEARQHVAPMAELGGVELATALRDSPPSILADPLHLKRLLVNLVSNAVQHTPRGGRVELRALGGDGRACVFEVEDTGQGIPEKARDLIFEKFGQAEVRNFNSGAGLGLPLCKWVVRAHSGLIEVRSELGKGTTFRVEIPREPR